MKHSELDEVAIREIADELKVDRRSVKKQACGGEVRGLVGARIRRAISDYRRVRK